MSDGSVCYPTAAGPVNLNLGTQILSGGIYLTNLDGSIFGTSAVGTFGVTTNGSTNYDQQTITSQEYNLTFQINGVLSEEVAPNSFGFLDNAGYIYEPNQGAFDYDWNEPNYIGNTWSVIMLNSGISHSLQEVKFQFVDQNSNNINYVSYDPNTGNQYFTIPGISIGFFNQSYAENQGVRISPNIVPDVAGYIQNSNYNLLISATLSVDGDQLYGTLYFAIQPDPELPPGQCFGCLFRGVCNQNNLESAFQILTGYIKQIERSAIQGTILNTFSSTLRGLVASPRFSPTSSIVRFSTRAFSISRGFWKLTGNLSAGIACILGAFAFTGTAETVVQDTIGFLNAVSSLYSDLSLETDLYASVSAVSRVCIRILSGIALVEA